MTHLSRWLARSALGIGMAIGLILNFSIAPAVACPTSSLQTTIDPCDTTGMSTEMQQFVNVQCAVHAAIFGDETEPSAFYSFASQFVQGGEFLGTDHLSRNVSFETVYVVPIPVANDSGLLSAGVQATSVWGRLSGPSGTVPVSGVLLLTGSLSEDTARLLMVTTVLTEAQLDNFAVASRILGGVRVVNATTLNSQPFSPQTPTGPLVGSSSDPSTLYAGVDGEDQEVDLNCIASAYASYQNAVNAATSTAATCKLENVALWSIAMGVCGSVGIIAGWSVIGLLGVLACVAVASAVLAVSLASCEAAEAIAVAAARNQLVIDLQACGVNIVES